MVHSWNVCDNERIVMPDELEVVGCTGGRADKLLEGEFRSLAASTGNIDFAAPDNLRVCMRRVIDRVTQELEPLLRVLLCGLAQRMVIDGSWRPRDFAVICWGIEVDDVQIGLEEVNAWDEGFALNAVFVQVVWMAVGCGDENNAVGHEVLKKPGWQIISWVIEWPHPGIEHLLSQYHSIGYIRTLELVKAKHA